MRGAPWLALASAALFGAATPAGKPLLATLGPLGLAGLLYLGAAAATAPAAFLPGRVPVWHSTRATRLRVLGAVVFGGVLGPVLLLSGLRAAGAGDVSLWLNLELVATAALGHFAFRDRLGAHGWLAAASVLAGAVLLAGPVGGGWLPLVLVALACLAWGLDNHLTALVDGIHPSQSTFWKGLVGGATNLALAFLVLPPDLAAAPVLAAVGIGALGYGVSITLYIHAAHGMGATRAQLVFATAPLWGLLGAALLLGERLEWSHVGAVALMGIGVALLWRDRHDHEHHHPAMAHSHSHRHDDGHHDHVHPGLPASLRHTHWHEHGAVTHRHPHWPDLHHRHHHHGPPAGKDVRRSRRGRRARP